MNKENVTKVIHEIKKEINRLRFICILNDKELLKVLIAASEYELDKLNTYKENEKSVNESKKEKEILSIKELVGFLNQIQSLYNLTNYHVIQLLALMIEEISRNIKTKEVTGASIIEGVHINPRVTVPQMAHIYNVSVTTIERCMRNANISMYGGVDKKPIRKGIQENIIEHRIKDSDIPIDDISNELNISSSAVRSIMNSLKSKGQLEEEFSFRRRRLNDFDNKVKDLVENTPMNQTDITRKLDVSMATISNSITRLKENGELSPEFSFVKKRATLKLNVFDDKVKDLVENTPMNQTKIAKELEVSMATISKSINRLKKKDKLSPEFSFTKKRAALLV